MLGQFTFRTRLTATFSAIAAASLFSTAGSASAAPKASSVSPQIAYFSWSVRGGEVTSQEDIFTVDPINTKVTRLTNDSGNSSNFISDRDPAWSPDRSKLAIFRASTAQPDPTLYLIDGKLGKTLKKLVPGLSPIWYNATTLLYVQWHSVTDPGTGDLVYDGSNVWAVNTSTLATRQVTDLGPWVSVNGMSWNATGGLAFGYSSQTGPPDWLSLRSSVATLPASDVAAAVAGTGPPVSNVTFVTPDTVSATDPDWSPTADRIAYTQAVDYLAPEGYSVPQGEIMVMTLSNNSVQQLTDDSTPSDPRCSWDDGVTHVLVPCDDDSPAFSPDGSQLAYAHGQEDMWREIRVYNFTSHTTREVTTDSPQRFKGTLDW